jgi:Pyruvate phosphate dikinase, AMP/ATP-binding domain
MTKSLIRWFKDIRLQDVPAVGGKTASLGELRALLGDRVPEGFALTAQAYREALAEAEIEAGGHRSRLDSRPAVARGRPVRHGGRSGGAPRQRHAALPVGRCRAAGRAAAVGLTNCS